MSKPLVEVPELSPGLADVIPLPMMIERSESGGVNWTTREVLIGDEVGITAAPSALAAEVLEEDQRVAVVTVAPEVAVSASAVEVDTPEPAECRSRRNSLAED
jgi:hypothetical protein